MELNELLTEWITGRDALGNESSRFASRWRDSQIARMRSRVYTPNIDDLRAHVAKESKGADSNIRLAIGASGGLDVRLEVGGVATRWTHPHLSRVAGAPPLPSADDIARAKAIDTSKASLADTSEAITVLKRERNRLRDMSDAGADVEASLADINSSIAAVRVGHDRLIRAHKRAMVAEDLQNIDAAIDALATADPDIGGMLGVLSRQQKLDELSTQRERMSALAARLEEADRGR